MEASHAVGNEDDEAANTFHAFRGASYRDAHPDQGPRRIDWILLQDPKGHLRIESHKIIHDADESSGLYPSDHYPILADFRFQATGIRVTEYKEILGKPGTERDAPTESERGAPFSGLSSAEASVRRSEFSDQISQRQIELLKPDACKRDAAVRSSETALSGAAEDHSLLHRYRAYARPRAAAALQDPLRGRCRAPR